MVKTVFIRKIFEFNRMDPLVFIVIHIKRNKIFMAEIVS